MLTPRLTNAVYYNSIPVLLQEIDKTLFILANDLYYNTIYSLHKDFDGCTMMDLLAYKRILLYKSCNPDYCKCYTLEEIASKVILLIKRLSSSPININTTTTTTTIGKQCGLEGFAALQDCEFNGIAIFQY